MSIVSKLKVMNAVKIYNNTIENKDNNKKRIW